MGIEYGRSRKQPSLEPETLLKYNLLLHQFLLRNFLAILQRTRALPEFPPQLGDMVRHLVVALVLYDLCFFLSHYTFHKHALLYK